MPYELEASCDKIANPDHNPRKEGLRRIIASPCEHLVMGKRNWTFDELVALLERWEPSDLAHIHSA